MSKPTMPLMKYDAARTAVAEAHRVDEVKEIRDRAVAIQAYARQAQDDAMVKMAMEIKLRAERRAGELLREMEKHPGIPGPGRGNKTPSSANDGVLRPPTLADLGITRDQSSDWQKLAAIPSPEFERRVQAAVAKTDPSARIIQVPVAGGIAKRPGAPVYGLPAWAALKPADRARIIAEALASGSATSFNQTNENVDWAKWTWNPVTGCLHNCDYCYARDIAKRFYSDVSDDPEERFAPVFHPERLVAPANTTPGSTDPFGRDRNVFVCSMADLFGKWVPQEWIDAVFDQVKAHAEWRFLFLTKFPQRLAELAWPDNAWCGTTVDRQDRVKVAEKAFRGVKAGVRWLSCEPMLEPLKFSSLEMFQHLVIGAASASTQTPEFQPPMEWVIDLMEQARRAGCAVYLKRNLRCISDLPC